jgi:iron complex outermembrane receptor protein
VVKEKEGGFMKNGAGIVIGLLLCVFAMVAAAWAEEPKKGEREEEKAVLSEITVTGTHYSNPATPTDTRYGTQYNVVTEEQIKEQNSYDFKSTLRDVPGVMFQSSNMIGSQTSHSIYIRGRGSSHPAADFTIQYDGVPRFGGLFGQVLGDGIAVPMIGGLEVYKSPQPSQFGSGYALINVLPKYMTKEGQEAVLNSSAGSYGTVEENVAAGVKKGPFDLYMAQSFMRTDGSRPHSGADQQSYYGNSGYQINKEWNLRFLFNYVDAGTDAPEPDRTPTTTNGVSNRGAERYETGTVFSTLTLNHQYDKFGGFLKAYYNHTTFDILQELTNGLRYAGNTGGLHSRQDVEFSGIRGKETFHLWPGGEILLGTDLDMTSTKNTQRTYSELAPIPTSINGGQSARIWDFPDTRLISPYAAISQYVGSKEGFHIIPSTGVRYYNHDQFKDETAAQGGVVAGYRNTDLHVNYSQGVNYPTPVVLMNFVLQNSPVANASQYWKGLKPETVDHYEAGILHTFPGKGSLGATVFRDDGKNRVLAYMGGPIPLQFNGTIGHYDIQGVELTGTATPTKNLEFFAASTWLQSSAVGQNAVERDHLPYTPDFQFQAGFKWTFLEHYRLFMDMQHLRDMYQGTASRGGTLNFTPPSPADKLPNITLVNARVSRLFDYTPLHLKASEVFVAMNNITNQNYEYVKGYPVAGFTVFGGVNLRFN